jgi:hypothetical protein
LEKGELSFTVDLPSLFKELVFNDANLKTIGPGASYGFMVAMIKLNNIATIAMRDDNQEILILLEELGIVSFSGDEKEEYESIRKELK